MSYVEKALQFETPIESVNGNLAFLLAALRINVASALVLDQIKKNGYFNRDFVPDALKANFDSIYNSWENLTQLNPANSGTLDLQDVRLVHGLLGMVTEAGEIGAVLLTYLENGTLDTNNLGEEIGGLNWYGALVEDAAGLDHDQILDANIAQLTKRYPEGYTDQSANNRNKEAEQEAIAAELNKQPLIDQVEVQTSNVGEGGLDSNEAVTGTPETGKTSKK